MIFKRLIFAALCLCSCSTAPTHHTAPSSAPVRKSVSSAQKHVMAAQQSASVVGSSLAELESLTKDRPKEHGLVVKSQQEMETLGRELFQTQRDLVDAHDQIDELSDKVQTQTDKLNTAEQTIKDLKPKRGFSILSVVYSAISFVLNPMGWLIGKTVNLTIGIAISIALFTLAMYLFRKWRRRRTLTPSK